MGTGLPLNCAWGAFILLHSQALSFFWGLLVFFVYLRLRVLSNSWGIIKVARGRSRVRDVVEMATLVVEAHDRGLPVPRRNSEPTGSRHIRRGKVSSPGRPSVVAP